MLLSAPNSMQYMEAGAFFINLTTGPTLSNLESMDSPSTERLGQLLDIPDKSPLGVGGGPRTEEAQRAQKVSEFGAAGIPPESNSTGDVKTSAELGRMRLEHAAALATERLDNLRRQAERDASKNALIDAKTQALIDVVKVAQGTKSQSLELEGAHFPDLTPESAQHLSHFYINYLKTQGLTQDQIQERVNYLATREPAPTTPPSDDELASRLSRDNHVTNSSQALREYARLRNITLNDLAQDDQAWERAAQVVNTVRQAKGIADF